MQGRIACCNVLSDLFSMGVTDVDVILMVLAISTRMSETEKEVRPNVSILESIVFYFRLLQVWWFKGSMIVLLKLELLF